VTLLLTNSKAVIILLSVSQSLVSIVGPGCFAAAAELSPTSHSGLGVVSSSLFRGDVSASGISALRLVDARGIVCGGQIRGAKKNGGSGGIGASSSVGTKSLGCLGSGMYTSTWSSGTYSGERRACSNNCQAASS
ncbi:hypothetical protein Tco_0083102, partial [Tanacetum coccineum]